MEPSGRRSPAQASSIWRPTKPPKTRPHPTRSANQELRISGTSIHSATIAENTDAMTTTRVSRFRRSCRRGSPTESSSSSCVRIRTSSNRRTPTICRHSSTLARHLARQRAQATTLLQHGRFYGHGYVTGELPPVDGRTR
ncbi:hypothetical protein ACFPRL_25190 [Pseudoclavibacter helvolus]